MVNFDHFHFGVQVLIALKHNYSTEFIQKYIKSINGSVDDRNYSANLLYREEFVSNGIISFRLEYTGCSLELSDTLEMNSILFNVRKQKIFMNIKLAFPCVRYDSISACISIQNFNEKKRKRKKMRKIDAKEERTIKWEQKWE